jgi:hypothetical protein
VRRRDARGRLPRVAAVFAFVGEVADDEGRDSRAGQGLDWLRHLAGEEDAPAILLAALLLALGERAQVDYTRELPFVRVELHPQDVAALPPHASLLQTGSRVFLALAARHRKSPMGFIPRDARLGLARRRRPVPALDPGAAPPPRPLAQPASGL